VLQIPALIFLVHGPEDIDVYVLYSMPFSCIALGYNFWYLRNCGLLRLRDLYPTLRGARHLLREAWPLVLAIGATTIYYNCDAIILGYVSGDKAVGLYTSAYKLMLVAFVIPATIQSVYMAVFSKVRDSHEEAKRVTNEFSTLLAWTGWPIAALGWACGSHLAILMYGDSFAESGAYLEWLCLDIGFAFMNNAIASPLLAWGYQKTVFKITALAAVLNLVANLILIPRYGAWGAVVTTIGAEAAVFVLAVLARKRIGLGWSGASKTFLTPFLCSIAVGAAVRFLVVDRYAWWLAAILGAMALSACFAFFERQMFLAAWRLIRAKAGVETPL
jgi:O-antigen/teichoic acid export membrane protein